MHFKTDFLKNDLSTFLYFGDSWPKFMNFIRKNIDIATKDTVYTL